MNTRNENSSDFANLRRFQHFSLEGKMQLDGKALNISQAEFYLSCLPKDNLLLPCQICNTEISALKFNKNTKYNTRFS